MRLGKLLGLLLQLGAAVQIGEGPGTRANILIPGHIPTISASCLIPRQLLG